MQTSSSLTGLEFVLLEIAKFIGSGGIGSLTTWLLLRKKVAPEVDAIQAGAEKTRAEARRLDAETINQAYERIDELWDIAESQRERIRALSMDTDKKSIELRLLDDEITWLSAVMKAAGVKLSDYDYLRQKRQP